MNYSIQKETHLINEARELRLFTLCVSFNFSENYVTKKCEFYFVFHVFSFLEKNQERR